MTSIIETIAAWCSSQTEFSHGAREHAKHAIADTIGCMFAGQSDFSPQAARRAFAGYLTPDGPSSIVGGGKANEAVAALINATAAHALDYDDNFLPGMSHASAVLVPALLAIAEARNAGGSSLIDAYLIGLQAQAFVGDGVGSSHYTAGWHGTSTIGTIGTAAGIAWLIGLDADGIARSLSNAVSLASGMKGQFGTPIKPLHAGLAARNAIDAAKMAASGMTGRFDILEGEQGFRELFGGRHPGQWDARAIAATVKHTIETAGVLPKRHPCCGSTHLISDAILDLKALEQFEIDNVVSVETLVGISNWRNLSYPRPQDEMQARFSMQYCVARILRNDSLVLSDFTQEAVRNNPDVELMGRVSMTPYTEEQELVSGSKLPHVVTIHLADGRTLKAKRQAPKGALDDPFDAQDREKKFMDCCGNLANGRDIYRRLCALEHQDDMHFLTPVFAL
ncbi:MmgE/PrpD family protein [Phyllobacterium myrsinacearum]|uniref:2-methylcitrate dehydratase PrpD n=1 Tax=Phyllobacterium myrsinacearum TaxID=28101 RepID=A0A839EU95_9HYPH|nr:MmgE/PrpD family protein [Phyllobacterium myrsinacearum]MBA8881074.1 2-methylcitrate dehydratase PrpD [Phyllobacterium myrsinacearum]